MCSSNADQQYRYDFQIVPSDGTVPFETVKTDDWTVSTETCRSKCKANKRCAFFTHVLDGKDVCQLFSDFSEVTLKNTSRGYVTSERERSERYSSPSSAMSCLVS